MKNIGNKVVWILALCLLTAPLGAWASGAKEGPGASPAAAQASSKGPVRGGEAVLLKENDFASMDPHMGDQGPHVVYERLLDFHADKNGKFGIYPQLAESWKISDDRLKVTFAIRKGVKFHDGSDLNAEVVAWNIRRMVQAPKSIAKTFLGFLDANNPATVVDPYTVQVNLKEPNSNALFSFTGFSCAMVSKKAVEDNGDNWLATHAVGTGAFMFSKWVPGSTLELVRNPNYWDSGEDGKPLPYLDKITWRLVREYSTALAEMLAGRADFMTQSLDVKDLDNVKKASNLVYFEYPIPSNMMLFFNATKPPFKDNLNLRLAFQYAIDRDTGARVMYGALGKAHPWFLVPGMTGYSESVPGYSYDPAKAKDYLAKAGVPVPFTVTMQLINREADVKIGEMLQAMLDKVGIKVNLEVMERTAWLQKVRSPNPQYEMAMRNNVWSGDAPAALTYCWVEGGEIAYMRAHVDGLMEIINQASKEPDLDRQAAFLLKAQGLMHDSAWMVYLWRVASAGVHSTRLQGVTAYLAPEEFYRIGARLWIAK